MVEKDLNEEVQPVFKNLPGLQEAVVSALGGVPRCPKQQSQVSEGEGRVGGTARGWRTGPAGMGRSSTSPCMWAAIGGAQPRRGGTDRCPLPRPLTAGEQDWCRGATGRLPQEQAGDSGLGRR